MWAQPGLGTIRHVAADAEAAPVTIGESRLPPALILLGFMVVNVVVRVGYPQDGILRIPWLAPLVELALVIVLLTSDTRSTAERVRLRRTTLLLTGLLVLAAGWATGVLISDLIAGTGASNSPGELLASGALVWLGNNLVFSLVYWLMDGGGPTVRSRHPGPVDFAFTQQLNPELGDPGWRPVFLDYVHLGFTNATAFSPTDVMPLTHRAKFAMVLQATIALALFGLVVARAVNAFQ
jgi:hypothetical protein